MCVSNIMKFDERLTEKTMRGNNWSVTITGGLPVLSLFIGHLSIISIDPYF